KTHNIQDCNKFTQKLHRDRVQYIRSKGLCYGCLKKTDHLVKDCTHKLSCATCKQKHPTVLHIEKNCDKEDKTVSTTVGMTEIYRGTSEAKQAAYKPVVLPVILRCRATGISTQTYAFLDGGSDSVFCTDSISGQRTKLNVHTINGNKATETYSVSGLEVISLDGHWSPISVHPGYYSSLKERHTAPKGHSRLRLFTQVRTLQGWTVGGALIEPATELVDGWKVQVNVNKIETQTPLPLPFREENVVMPNNKAVAEYRLKHLERKFTKNPQYHKDYAKYMQNNIDKAFAERIPGNELPHGIYHPQKKKLRVVFDCGAVYSGTSLNKELLQGPDLTNSLLGVLIRFRQEAVALMAIIEGMFSQVTMPKNFQNFQRFLWWPEGDFHQPAVEYRDESSPVWCYLVT
ncbi:uncharacterized protein LOC144357010, partial [Saccoglossus kowalevskii]